MGRQVYSPYALPILGLFFYLDAIFFLPADPILIVYCVEQRTKALYYATVATICSVAGGLTAYGIGYLLWHYAGEQIMYNKIVGYIISPPMVHYLCGQYNQYAAWVVPIASFIPLPYKATSLTAGFCAISPLFFIIFSLIGRGARFFTYAIIFRIWGKQMKEYIERYFSLLLIAAVVAIVITLWLVHRHAQSV